MKTILVAVMLLALYLLYRIAFPKAIKKQKPTSVLSRQKVNEKEIIGQSRVVLSFQRQAVPVAAKTRETVSSPENADSFVPENESGMMVINWMITKKRCPRRLRRGCGLCFWRGTKPRPSARANRRWCCRFWQAPRRQGWSCNGSPPVSSRSGFLRYASKVV